MILYIGLCLTIILGFVFVSSLSNDFSITEKIGLFFPIGLALETILMIICDQIGLDFSISSILLTETLLLFTLLPVFYYKKRTLNVIGKINSSLFTGFNFVWLLFIILIIYLEYMNFSKCMFFPPSDRDSLSGFETIGYVAAQEHTFLGLSLFNSKYITGMHDAGSYITYAPFVQLSYAYVYTLGAVTSKIIPGLMYLFFLIAFNGAVSRNTTRTGAAIATLFMMITPEMIAFSSLSMTNVMHAIYASLGVIYFAIWYKNHQQKDLLLSSVLLGLNMWCRTEGIVFIAAALSILFIKSLSEKKIILFFKYSFIMIFPSLLWVVLQKINGLYADTIIVTKIFWDTSKANIIKEYMLELFKNTTYYGWSFYAFIIILLANSWYMIKKKESFIVPALVFIAIIGYVVVLYQIDYKWEKIENVLSYSAKRFMFCFIPLLWFYICTNHFVKKILNLLDKQISL